MLDFLTYDAKVAVLILAFYICYRPPVVQPRHVDAAPGPARHPRIRG